MPGDGGNPGVGVPGKPGYVGGGGAGVPGAGAVGGAKAGDACAMFTSCLDCLSLINARASMTLAANLLSSGDFPNSDKSTLAKSSMSVAVCGWSSVIL